MRKVLLDTSVILHYMRDDATSRKIEETHHLLSDPTTIVLISAVSVAEIEGFFLRHSYGSKQTERWSKLLEKSIILNIDGRDERLMKAYAEIQAYCQNNHPKLKPGKSQNIGQNDIWIAAIAFVVGAILFSKDEDFAHLDGVFIDWVPVGK